jgi:dermatan 4-sulfotransferase 1
LDPLPRPNSAQRPRDTSQAPPIALQDSRGFTLNRPCRSPILEKRDETNTHPSRDEDRKFTVQTANLVTIFVRFRQWIHARGNRINVWTVPGRNIGYIAVPKAASSSIRNAIRLQAAAHYFPGRDFSRSEMKERVDPKIHYSTTAATLRDRPRDPYLFSFVRNPFTRLYSCYRDKVINAVQRKEACTLAKYGISFGMTFNEFVEQICTLPDDRSDQHFRSQHTLLTHGQQILVDFLGKFESIESDWARIEPKIGFPLPARSRRVSGPPVLQDQLPLDPAVARKAIVRYEKDITLFGYEQEVDRLIRSSVT